MRYHCVGLDGVARAGRVEGRDGVRLDSRLAAEPTRVRVGASGMKHDAAHNVQSYNERRGDCGRERRRAVHRLRLIGLRVLLGFPFLPAHQEALDVGQRLVYQLLFELEPVLLDQEHGVCRVQLHTTRHQIWTRQHQVIIKAMIGWRTLTKGHDGFSLLAESL